MMQKGGHISADVMRYLLDHERSTWNDLKYADNARPGLDLSGKRLERWVEAREAVRKALAIMLDPPTPPTKTPQLHEINFLATKHPKTGTEDGR